MKQIIAGILVPLILIHGLGCYSYKAVKVHDAEKTDKIEQVRIRTITDKTYILAEVYFDSLHIRGKTVQSHTEWLRNDQKNEIFIPYEEIKKIEASSLDAGLTAGFGLGIGLFLIMSIGLAASDGIMGDFNLKL